MNQAEIISALNAVRSVGQEFTKSFNNLADMVEAMASENESLHSKIGEQDSIIKGRDDFLAAKQKEVDSSYARAIKAERDVWELAQKVAKLEQDNDRQSQVIATH